MIISHFNLFTLGGKCSDVVALDVQMRSPVEKCSLRAGAVIWTPTSFQPVLFRGLADDLHHLGSVVNFCEQVKVTHPVKEDFLSFFVVQNDAVFGFDGDLKLFDCLTTDHEVSLGRAPICRT